MKLYHGFDVLIDVIILDKSKPFKDFGKGFYLSDDYNQAFDMTKQRVRQKMGIGTPIVTTFEFDEQEISKGDLNVKIWNDYCVEWAEFVIRNR